MAFARWSIAGLILYTWMRLSGSPAPSLAQWKTTAIVGVCLLVGGNGLLSWAEQEVASSVAAITIGSVPLWIVVIDAVRPNGIRPNLRTVIGVLLGFLGIFILINPFKELIEVNQENGFRCLLCLALRSFWSIGSIYSRENHSNLPEKPLLASGMEMLAGAVGLFLTGTFLGEWKAINLSGITPQALLGFGYLIVFGSFVGYVSYSWLLGVASTPLVSTYAYVNPLVAVLLGGLLAGELINGRVLAAAFLIVGAVFLTNSTRLQKDAVRRKTDMADLKGDQ